MCYEYEIYIFLSINEKYHIVRYFLLPNITHIVFNARGSALNFT